MAVGLMAEAPDTPLRRDFTPMATEMYVYESASIDSKKIKLVPTGRRIPYRAHPTNEVWIYIDDDKSDTHGWAISSGGYFDGYVESSPEDAQAALDYAIRNLEYNSDFGKISEDYDKGIDEAISGQRNFSPTPPGEGFLKWMIIISVLLTFYVLAMALSNSWLRFGSFALLATSVLELIYSLLPDVYKSFSDNALFGLFLIFLLQIGAYLVAFKKVRIIKNSYPPARLLTFISMAIFALCSAIAIFQVGIAAILAAAVGGVINILVGIVVIIAVYGLCRDGFSSKGGASDSSDGNRRKNTGCDTCRWYRNPGLAAEDRYCHFGYPHCHNGCSYHQDN